MWIVYNLNQIDFFKFLVIYFIDALNESKLNHFLKIKSINRFEDINTIQPNYLKYEKKG